MKRSRKLKRNSCRNRFSDFIDANAVGNHHHESHAALLLILHTTVFRRWFFFWCFGSLENQSTMPCCRSQSRSIRTPANGVRHSLVQFELRTVSQRLVIPETNRSVFCQCSDPVLRVTPRYVTNHGTWAVAIANQLFTLDVPDRNATLIRNTNLFSIRRPREPRLPAILGHSVYNLSSSRIENVNEVVDTSQRKSRNSVFTQWAPTNRQCFFDLSRKFFANVISC